jgi:hypothetical protein
MAVRLRTRIVPVAVSFEMCAQQRPIVAPKRIAAIISPV